jgi:multidrug efflux pump subunit AcrA (membrane-fusion protein)
MADWFPPASNELVASLRSELEAQRTLGSQSRNLQKQLKERDVEMAKLKAQADEARSQLASSQSEIKALQTKLAAARNTAASIEASKVQGSAIKGGAANRATAAATAEAAQVAQLAQLKEDLYTDFTGLIIRDVKNRETDHLYDCIQTGVNGSKYPQVPGTKRASYSCLTNLQRFISSWPSPRWLARSMSRLNSSIYHCWMPAVIGSLSISCQTF